MLKAYRKKTGISEEFQMDISLSQIVALKINN
jgi:hypothetical protein